MWNYRVVRKRNALTGPEDRIKKISYSYGIYEAHYDNNGYVGAITQDPIDAFGENIEELRDDWVMMAEAFGQPILDYDNIPEPGYDSTVDPVSALGETLKELAIPDESVKRALAAKVTPLSLEIYSKEAEETRIEKERVHRELFVGKAPLKELIEKIYSDFRERDEKGRVENRDGSFGSS